MPLPLDKDTVLNRLRDYPHDNYLYLGGIAKGVAMAVAALVLLQIFADLSDRWYKLFPWIGALAASLVSYSKWGRGVLLTNSRANTRDNILPLLLGIMEFFLFAMLIEDKTHPLFWRHWPLALAAHSLLAVFLVANRYISMNTTQDFDPDLQPIATELKKWMRGDMGGSIGSHHCRHYCMDCAHLLVY